MIDYIYTPKQMGEAARYLTYVTLELGGKLKTSLTPKRKGVEDLAGSIPVFSTQYDFHRNIKHTYEGCGPIGRFLLQTIAVIEDVKKRAMSPADYFTEGMINVGKAIAEDPKPKKEKIEVTED
jgi:hypothetical protein